MNKYRHGFTFIEMVVVIAVLVIALPSLFAIIFSILQQQIKVNRISVVKREGDYALTVIKNSIRGDAYRLYNGSDIEICTTLSSGDSVTSFGKIDDSQFSYTLSSSQIKKNLPLPSQNLTSGQVIVSLFSITCSRINQFSPATVFVSFDICYKGSAPTCSTARGEEAAAMHYQSYITLRNY